MLRFFAISTLLAAGPCTKTAPEDTEDTEETVELVYDEAASFAVLELFTSEGCSSCPPADDVLATLAEERADERVFPMAWHVDYWDYLGWVDPWGDPAYSERQYDYGRAFGLSGVYTPQSVVNGTVEFVGSSSNKTHIEVGYALKDAVEVAVTLWVLSEPTDEAIAVDYDVQGHPEGTTLHVLLLESDLVSEVTAGENRNKTLHHANVVRSWVQVEPGTGQVSVPVPAGLVLDSSHLVGLVQDDETMALVGATRTLLE